MSKRQHGNKETKKPKKTPVPIQPLAPGGLPPLASTPRQSKK
jgi:hypothetical protein